MPLPVANKFTPVALRPLTGIFDERSQPDEMARGAFRLVQNWQVRDENKLCRRYGWQKFRSKSSYNNDDLHDQLISLQTYYASGSTAVDPATVTTYPNAACSGAIQTRSTGRQPITLLYPALSGYGAKKLLAGTESRLYAYNENTGNWKILADGYGTGLADGALPRRRFYAAQVAETVFFTNDFNKPIMWPFSGKTFGCGQQAVSTLPDLDAIGLSQAAVIWAYKNCIFLANVVMDGKRYRNRILWSDYGDGSSFDPAKAGSITGIVDLLDDEEVLAGMELGNTFLIYTTKRIWEIIVGGEAVFNFEKRYPAGGNNAEGILFYRNTLVSDGERHFYLGQDGIYTYDLYTIAPRRVEWIHKATQSLFRDIDDTACDNHVGHYNTDTKEIWFSYATKTSSGQFPNKTISLNAKYGHSSTIDHGFTAFTRFEPVARGSLRDFFIRYYICTASELTTRGYGFIKEGLPRSFTSPAGSPITAIRTTTAKNVQGPTHTTYSATSLAIGTGTPRAPVLTDAGIVAVGHTIRLTSGANWMQGAVSSIVGSTVTFTPTSSNGSGTYSDWVVTAYATASVEDASAAITAGSLCTKLGTTTIADVCGTCKLTTLSVMVSSTDWCVKEGVAGYYRERCTNVSATGTSDANGYYAAVGVYSQDGYESILRSGPEHFGRPDADKHVNYIEFNVIPEAQTVPNKAKLRTGTSVDIVDPNEEHCPILWRQEREVDLACSALSAEQYAKAKTRPDTKPLSWSIHMIGPFFYWELKITGTGGGACFSSVVEHVRLICK